MNRLEELRAELRVLRDWRRNVIEDAERTIRAANRRFDAAALRIGKEIQTLESVPLPVPAPVKTAKTTNPPIDMMTRINDHFLSLSPEERDKYANQNYDS